MPYDVFVRTWWKENLSWPNGLEPCPGEWEYLARDVETREEAKEMAEENNDTHEPGPFARKAEFISVD